MKIELIIKNTENLGEWTPEKKERIQEIITALISSGGLTGIRGGKTIIHFDGDGNFRGVALDYWPFRNRKFAGN
ncbi:MAG: hypothetical protein HY919_02890 [Elusimicrobia bacterium]|nr:hypothetical protein [Elusimicrobiota bacterium]